MTLSRPRRIATGVAAGVLVLCAALLGANFRSDSSGISTAADLRPADAIPIPEDVDEGESDPESVEEIVADGADEDDVASSSDLDTGNSGNSDDTQSDVADGAEGDTGDADSGSDATESESDDTTSTAPVTVIDEDDLQAAETAADAPTATDEPAPDTSDDASSDSSETAAPAPEEASDTPEAPPVNTDGLGTGGGVDDAECSLDRLVIYAGARVGGVAGSLRGALVQNGFGAGCPAPITVLASNCPQQFAGVLPAGSSYDPSKPFVASSATVDRNAMTQIVRSTGFSGSQIDILDFSFVNPDKPGEKWLAIFIPPSFEGWETLASQAGLAPTTAGLCGPTGRVGS